MKWLYDKAVHPSGETLSDSDHTVKNKRPKVSVICDGLHIYNLCVHVMCMCVKPLLLFFGLLMKSKIWNLVYNYSATGPSEYES